MNAIQWCLDGMKFSERKKITDFIAFGDEFMSETENPNGSRIAYVMMSPDLYLSLAEPIKSDDGDRHNNLKKVLNTGKFDKFRSCPTLLVRKMEDCDDFKVYGHDGRHRAMLLKEAGFKEIPVKLVNDTFGFGGDLPKGAVYPKYLWCQNDKNADRDQYRFPFPLPEKDAGKTFDLGKIGIRRF